jgi:hypothetical protein
MCGVSVPRRHATVIDYFKNHFSPTLDFSRIRDVKWSNFSGAMTFIAALKKNFGDLI